MPDHLRLTSPTLVLGRRRPPNAGLSGDFDRSRHATTIKGILEGLESTGVSFSPSASSSSMC
ncbi:hypothetical protein, partial [Cryobacterium roopkundense]|uniref:hypothetical protein n=1 Tax=Cryobacterium roopkundense TaxID=1001240 RepID=UPI001F21C9EE